MLALALWLACQDAVVPSASAEAPIEAPIVALDLFKNGEAVVERALRLPGDGTYVLYEDLPHRHGTLRIDAPGTLELERTTRVGDVSPPVAPEPDEEEGEARSSYLGRRARLRLVDEERAVEGVLRSIPRGMTGYVQEVRRYGDRRWMESSNVVLETEDGTLLVSPDRISTLEVLGDAPAAALAPERGEVPAVVLRADGFGGAPSEARLSYLAHGVSWAPTYALRLIDGEELELVRGATIRNELADLDDVRVRLVTGTPVMVCRTVDSPFGAPTTLSSFFEQLLRAEDEDHWHWWWPRGDVHREARLMSQVSAYGRGSANDASVPVEPTTEDLSFRSIGRRSLARGDSLHVELERARADYESLVRVEVEALGNREGQWRRSRRPEEGPPARAWNLLRFANPASDPTSTGPVTVVDEQGWVAQVELPWSSPNAVVDLRTSRALTVVPEVRERELGRKRVEDHDGHWNYDEVTVLGELTLVNHRAVPVRADVSVDHYGRHVVPVAEDAVVPEARLRANEEHRWNPLTTVRWDVELPPGEPHTLYYRYLYRTR